MSNFVLPCVLFRWQPKLVTEFNLGDKLISYIREHHPHPQKIVKSDMSFDSFPEVIFDCITVDPSPKFIQLTEICKLSDR